MEFAEEKIIYRVVFLRHGESIANNNNTWGSWTDVDLSPLGIEEAKQAGNLLKNWEFDIVYTSILKRTVKTWNIIADVIDQHHVPVYKNWRLNEKHYGALIGLNKVDISKKYGEHQVKMWRRSFSSRPPELDKDDPRNPAFDSLYKNIPKGLLPLTESFEDSISRVIYYWNDIIVPNIRAGKKVFLCVHGNTIRSILKYVEKLSEDEILELDIPNGFPLVCEFDSSFKFKCKHYLGDHDQIKKKIEMVKNQGKIK